MHFCIICIIDFNVVAIQITDFGESRNSICLVPKFQMNLTQFSPVLCIQIPDGRQKQERLVKLIQYPIGKCNNNNIDNAIDDIFNNNFWQLKKS